MSQCSRWFRLFGHCAVLLLGIALVSTPAGLQPTTSTHAQTEEPMPGWTPGEPITDGNLDALAPELVIDTLGVSHVVYVVTDFADIGNVFYRNNRGGVWSEPVPISSHTRTEAGGGNTMVAIGSATISNTVHLAVAFQGRESSGRRRIWYRESHDGGVTWLPEEEATEHSGVHPALVLDATGTPHLVYVRSDENQLVIYYATKGADGQWGAEHIGFDVDRNPDITSTQTPTGQWLHVAFQSQPGQTSSQDEMQVLTRSRAPDGTWSHPDQRMRDIAQYPSITSDRISSVYTVWSARAPDVDVDPFFSFSPNNGGSWEAPTNVGSETSDLGQRPDIARSPASGMLAVVWEDDYQTRQFEFDIFGRMSADGGSTWSPVQPIFQGAGGSGSAALAANPTGGFRTVWDDGIYGKLRIFTSAYNDPGAAPPTVIPTVEPPTVAPTVAPTVPITPTIPVTPTVAPAPQLSSNYASGAPGSFFTITGSDFPAVPTGTLTINGQELGSIPIGSTGEFTFLLSTTVSTPPGIYLVNVAAGAANASTSFTLNATAALRPRDTTIVGTPIAVPSQVRPATSLLYLPVLVR